VLIEIEAVLWSVGGGGIEKKVFISQSGSFIVTWWTSTNVKNAKQNLSHLRKSRLGKVIRRMYVRSARAGIGVRLTGDGCLVALLLNEWSR